MAATRSNRPAAQLLDAEGQVIGIFTDMVRAVLDRAGLVFNCIDVFLACNRVVPDEVITRLNSAFSALEREGMMLRIERAYDHWPVRQTGKQGGR